MTFFVSRKSEYWNYKINQIERMRVMRTIIRGECVTHKFENKEELNNWARNNISNEATLAAVLTPVSTVDGKPIDDDKIVYEGSLIDSAV